jgi:hypothetical protein
MSETNTQSILKQRKNKTIINEEPQIEPLIETPIVTPSASFEPGSVLDHQPIKVKKPRKPKTEKQMESFKLIAAKRQENINQKKIAQKIEASKFLLEHDELPSKAKLRAKATHKQISIEPDESSSSDESQPKIIIKKIHKKKKKPVIIHIEESSDEESSEEEPIKTPPIKQPTPQPQPAKQFISQQNKKSLIQIVPVKNYFVE